MEAESVPPPGPPETVEEGPAEPAPEHPDEDAQDVVQSFNMDYESMPMHFLAEGDDPPVIMIPEPADNEEEQEPALPMVKIRRNYACAQCDYLTQNPRSYLTHLRHVHNERMRIYECPHCTYASRHSQKMHRHVSMVHNPHRGDRRRPGPPPRQRDEYYADFVKELHKRQEQRKRRQEAHLLHMEERLEQDAARSKQAKQQQQQQQGAARAPKPVAKVATATVTAAAATPPPVAASPAATPRAFEDDDDDDEDRLVIANSDDEADGNQDDRAADEAADGDDPDDGQGDDDQDDDGQDGELDADPDADPDDDQDVDDLIDEEDAELELAEQAPGRKRSKHDDGRYRDVRMDMDLATGLYSCSSCDFTSRTPSLVARHESVVHLKKRFYRCNKCSYVTHMRARYTKHYKYHTMPLIKCDECEFRTPYKWNLDRHIKNHGGLGKYKCRACSFSSEIRQSLTVHEMNHHDPPVGPPSGVPHRRRQNKVGATELVNAALSAHLYGSPGRKADDDDDRPAAGGASPGGTPRRTDADAAATSSTSVTATATGRLPLHQALRCSLCDFRTPFFADMSRHMAGVHGSSKGVRTPPTLTPAPTPQASTAAPAKRPAKPLPNLIPIQATALAQQSRTTPTPAAPPGPNGAAVNGGPSNGEDAADPAKKKNSFFDQLKLYPGNVEGSELVCVHCGHEAKCLSELVRHTKLHQGTGRGVGTSTRCQHCRHRCKTSADLAVHLKACIKAAAAAAGLTADDDASRMDVDPPSDPTQDDDDEDEPPAKPAPLPEYDEDSDDDFSPLADDRVPRADASLVGVETAPGYGLVTNHAELLAQDKNPLGTTFSSRKVFKCPHCTFWAATASRFHVHMVGHLNKKPFACSVCKYRSNWRWDITKHIRLKEGRDSTHANAKTLMTDETGRRNYSKYNMDLLWLKVAEPDAENLQAVLGGIKAVSGNMATTETGPGHPPPLKTGTILPKPGTTISGLGKPTAKGGPIVIASKSGVLPAPPKLTRAPAPRIQVQSSSSSSPGGLLRPPPPLQAAAGSQNSSPAVNVQQQGQSPAQPHQSLKRPADTPVPKVGADPKKSNTDIKKTVWRCKQCHFRDGDRAVVLTHVKGHYRQQQEAALAKTKNAAGSSQESKTQEPQSVLKKAPFRCDTCPFVSVSESVMQSHVNCHKQRDDVFFKCFYCPYYVATKEEVIQHMTVHQQNSKGESSSTSIKNAVPRSAVPAASQSPSSSHAASNKQDFVVANVQVKKEVDSDQVTSTDPDEEIPPPDQALSAPFLDFTNVTESPLCWVLRDGKLLKMLRCRHCPHVNLRRTNMQEHERMHSKRTSVSGEETGDSSSQYSPYPCPNCNYVCNNAGVLSSHLKVHLSNYPQAYAFHDPYRSELLQMKEVIDKFRLKINTDDSAQKLSPPKDPVDVGNENKLSGINVMSLLDPNQSLTDAVLAMKKKFNLELDGEPFAEPVEDSAESPPCSPLKQLNDGGDPAASEMHEEKQLYFCMQCPARFLFRKELGIHSRFHNLYLIHKCDHCSYTARQRPHLQAHYKVHSEDYQDRTNALLKMYSVNKEYPKPRVVCVNHKVGVPGTLWIVVNTDYQEPPAPTPNFGCQKCPASFFKTDAYQAHMALHGSNNPHKCPICDYAVRTYGNLIKHMITHGCRASVAKKILQGRMAVPESLRPASSIVQSNCVVAPKEEPQSFDNEDQQDDASHSANTGSNNDLTDGGQEVRDDFNMDVDEKEEVDIGAKSEDKDRERSPSKSPPPNSSFASGSPEFVYPTSCRNGRVKVKRFKCQKCPSAFEKKDQYLVHVSLHGSKQKYKCTKCDYSVKFFANHIQHLRRHQISEDAKSKDHSDPQPVESEEFIPEDTENIPSPAPISPTRSAKTTGGKGEKLSVADKQAIMVLQQRRAKRAAISRESLDKNYWCSHCPYSSVRRDQVESHMRRHIAVSGVRNAYVCEHCDYSVPTRHFLRDHSKLHFDVSKAPRPDAYMICDRLELWASSGFTGKKKSKGKVLIFQDKGANLTADRFLPPLSCEETEDSNGSMDRVYVNPRTFESENVSEVGSKETLDTTGEAEHEEEGDSDCRKSEKSTDGLGKECAENEALFLGEKEGLVPSDASRSSTPHSDKSMET